MPPPTYSTESPPGSESPGVSSHRETQDGESSLLKSSPTSTELAEASRTPASFRSPKTDSPRGAPSPYQARSQRPRSGRRRRKLTTKEFQAVSNWLSAPKRSELAPRIVRPSYRNEDVLDCLLEHVVSLMVYKYTFQRSLESKLGLLARPSADLYLKGIYSVRSSLGRVVYPVLDPPLTLHEQNCLASHPLWASNHQNKRFHIPWKPSQENMLTDSDFYPTPSRSSPPDLSEAQSPPSSAASARRRSSANPAGQSQSRRAL
ncbi:uncharacterized protein LOC115073229 [Rhinatrema bivittatum]|uniref:uncharacterized protein LOC115073229 n=1 Tax=Rhinatrema bivittatum TaxID=194408 RepID=UPI00112B05BB|nr:uncharacterized protein LOC115073229 [Rhinatrema bivittatum]